MLLKKGDTLIHMNNKMESNFVVGDIEVESRFEMEIDLDFGKVAILVMFLYCLERLMKAA